LYEVAKALDEDAASWDGFVVRQPGWTHCHLFGWRRVITDVFSHECDYLVARDGSGEMAGVLPLVHVRSLLFGNYVVSMPFLNYGGPLGAAGAQEALTGHAVQLAKARKAKLMELRCRSQQSVPLSASKRKVTVTMALPRSADQLFDSFSSKLRSQVRRPSKEGVTVRFGREHLGDFYRVFARNMRDLGTPVMPSRFFEHAARQFGDAMWVGVAYLNDVPVASGCGFQWGGEFEMTWASSLREHNRIAPNMLLYWSFMQRAVNARLSVFNFGRCSPDSGTHRFKKQWDGAIDEQLWWYQFSNGRDKNAAVGTPSPDGMYSIGPQVWRRLPEKVATALGPRIVRFIP
jgi:FemAB-related protein (PEP-CTERM system-associated)